MINRIKHEDFKKLDLRVGEVIEVSKVPKTQKLYKMLVDVGDKKIQIISSLADYYSEDELLNKKIIVLTNLEPAKFRGEASEGMLLCAENQKNCVLLTVDKDIDIGTKIT